MNKLFKRLIVCAIMLSGAGIYAQTDSTTTSTETAEDDFFEMSLEEGKVLGEGAQRTCFHTNTSCRTRIV